MIGINPFIKPDAITISAITKTTFLSLSILSQKQTPTTTATRMARVMDTSSICLITNGVFGVSSNIYLLISSP